MLMHTDFTDPNKSEKKKKSSRMALVYFLAAKHGNIHKCLIRILLSDKSTCLTKHCLKVLTYKMRIVKTIPYIYIHDVKYFPYSHIMPALVYPHIMPAL